QQPVAPLDDSDVDGFDAGLEEELPTAEPFAEEVIEAAEVVHPAAEEMSLDSEFGAGLDFEPPPLPRPVPPPLPPRVKRAEPTPRPTPPPPMEDEDFGAGIVDEAAAAESV